MGNRLRLWLPNILFIAYRQDRPRSSAMVEAITAVRLDEFLIIVRAPGLLFCEIPTGLDPGTALSRLTGHWFSLALAEPLARNCTP